MPAPQCSMGLTGHRRYRRSIFGKMILQVEEQRRRARVYGDGYQAGDGILITMWRDASADDVRGLAYIDECGRRKLRNDPPLDWTA